jgi:hypothetical protein
MGTSNWQQVPFCVDVLMRIAPARVLDVGIGFGRWGIVVREFCDVWYGRVFPDQWAVHIEGIEAFPRSVTDYHRLFYNQIHLGDAAEVIPGLDGRWDVVIFGDVLEHFTKDVGRALLAHCLTHADYVLVNIPLGDDFEQGEVYENPYERHLAAWEVHDFEEFALVRRQLLRDYTGRRHGSFCLSRRDPKDVRTSLFSPGVSYADDIGTPADEDGLDPVLAQIADRTFELEQLRHSTPQRIARRLRSSRMWRIAQRLHDRKHLVRIRATGTQHALAAGHEVQLVGARWNAGDPPLPWDLLPRNAQWSEQPHAGAAYGRCLTSAKGELTIRLGDDPALEFTRYAGSGRIEVQRGSYRELIDLYAAERDRLVVHPARKPMVAIPEAATSTSGTQLPRTSAPPPLSAAQVAFIEQVRRDQPRALGVACPRWLGVMSSTRNVLAHVYSVPSHAEEDPYLIEAARVAQHAEVLASTGIRHIVFSGGDEQHLLLARELRRRAPDIRCDLLWHGSHLQLRDEYVWRMFRLWIDATEDGTIHTIGVVKKGLEAVLVARGVRAAFVMNSVSGDLQPPPVLGSRPRRLGMWMSRTEWGKSPHAMISAIPLLADVELHAAGLCPQSREVAAYLGVRFAVCHPSPLPHPDLLRSIPSTHLTLYVTFSECCPMLPLESLTLGVPCLIGPTSHLFEDDAFLFERLVVPFPDRADMIAAAVERCIDEREEIVSAYARWAPRYREAARASVGRFLD